MKLTEEQRLRRGYPPNHETGTLTPHKRRMISLVCEGLSNKEIAEELGTTEKTVKCQLTVIFQIQKVTTRAQLAAQRIHCLEEALHLAKVWIRGQPTPHRDEVIKIIEQEESGEVSKNIP